MLSPFTSSPRPCPLPSPIVIFFSIGSVVPCNTMTLPQPSSHFKLPPSAPSSTNSLSHHHHHHHLFSLRYFAGHEHSLQHIKEDGCDVNYFVCGAGHLIGNSSKHAVSSLHKSPSPFTYSNLPFYNSPPLTSLRYLYIPCSLCPPLYPRSRNDYLHLS